MFPLGQERTFHALIGISAFAQEPDIGTRPPDVSRHQRSNEMHRAMQLGRDALIRDQAAVGTVTAYPIVTRGPGPCFTRSRNKVIAAKAIQPPVNKMPASNISSPGIGPRLARWTSSGRLDIGTGWI